ncbi:hypothetical protein pb186bvf_000078 [Paramecium bursaria]
MSTILPEIKQTKRSSQYSRQAVYKSVDKLVRKNDLGSVIGYDNDYYPKILEDQKRIDETVEVHANLTELKKSCDKMKQTGLVKAQEMEKMRKEIDNMQNQIDAYEQSQQGVKSQEVTLQSKLDQQLQLLSDCTMQQKVFDHMLDRMRNDQVVYQLRANVYERDLQHSENQLQTGTYKYQQIKELYQKTRLALQEVTSGIDEQNDNRKKNLNKFKSELTHKQNMERKKEERKKRQQEIAEVAANDIKDSSLKKWRKLLLVHKFLNHFLKNKMQRGIKQFQHLEIAFQKIKASTGVTDANEIVQKFLGRESTYAHLLISISDYEKKIELFKSENAELQQTYNRLRQEYVDMDKELFVESYKQKEDLSEQDKMVLEVEEKATQSNLLSNKLQTWIKRNLKKLGISVQKGFPQILDVLKEKLLKLQEEQQYELLNKSMQSQKMDVYDQDFQRKNIRIKFKPKKSVNQMTNSSIEQPSRDEDDFIDVPIEEFEKDDEEEERLFRQQRHEIKQIK